MSRIIVKNIPKAFTEKDVSQHFATMGTVTDCKIARDENQVSRKFAFIGFKEKVTAVKAKEWFNGTFLGASKIMVDIARLIDEGDSSQAATSRNPSADSSKLNNKTKAKFEQYRRLVQSSVKQNWEAMTAGPPNTKAATPQEPKVTIKAPEEFVKTKRQAVHEKKVAKRQDPTTVSVKPSRISNKNKQYFNKAPEIDCRRLYITNIPYECPEEDLAKELSRYGTIVKLRIPRDYDQRTRGFAFVTYESEGQAMRAFAQLENKVVLGRIVHVKPSLEDIGEVIKTAKEQKYQANLEEKYGAEEKTSFKKQQKKKLRMRLDDPTNWNTVFLNPNTILEAVSKKLHVTKGQVLLSEKLAPKVAIAEAEIIAETKSWMKEVGISLDFLNTSRTECPRSSTTLLIKNLSHTVTAPELKELFSFYGVLNKLLLAPNKAIAVAQYASKDFARNALQKLQNHKFRNNYLMLEYAPEGLLSEEETQALMEAEKEAEAAAEELSKIVYVKNLNFSTTDSVLLGHFTGCRSAKIVRSADSRSLGYGFIEYRANEQAVKAIKMFQDKILQGHKLALSMSKSKPRDPAKTNPKTVKPQPKEEQTSCLMVRNVAFQATKEEVEELFREYGSIKKVRLPKKMDNTHRGFAFVDYNSKEEAALAKQMLGSAHLYGRKLVIEYALGQSSTAKSQL